MPQTAGNRCCIDIEYLREAGRYTDVFSSDKSTGTAQMITVIHKQMHVQPQQHKVSTQSRASPGDLLELAIFKLPERSWLDRASLRFQQSHKRLGTGHGILLSLVVVKGRLRVAGTDAPEGDTFSIILVVVLDDLVVQSQHVECSFAHAIVNQRNRRKLYAASKDKELASGCTRVAVYRVWVGNNMSRRKQKKKTMGLPLCLLCDRGFL